MTDISGAANVALAVLGQSDAAAQKLRDQIAALQADLAAARAELAGLRDVGDEALRMLAGQAIDAFPGKLHSEKITAVIAAIAPAMIARERERAANAMMRGDITRVGFYEREFYLLSNFSAFTLSWKSVVFDTSEAAYHWEKFPDQPSIQSEILHSKSAHAAFKIAEQCRSFRRPDWDAVKVVIMRDILYAKIQQHEYVRCKLMETDDRELVEDSWRDDFWGTGPNGTGQNMLGRLWMEVRAAIRAGTAP